MTEVPSPSPIRATPVETEGLDISKETRQQIELLCVQIMATVSDYCTKMMSAMMGLHYAAVEKLLSQQAGRATSYTPPTKKEKDDDEI